MTLEELNTGDVFQLSNSGILYRLLDVHKNVDVFGNSVYVYTRLGSWACYKWHSNEKAKKVKKVTSEESIKC